MSVWQEFNNNPHRRRAGDCAVRAVSIALGVDWETAYAMIAFKGFQMGEVMSSNDVWGAVLKDHGYYRGIIPNTCPECYTVEDFVKSNPVGVYVIASSNHVATAKNGLLYDAWNSEKEIPIFVWYMKELPFKGVGT